MTHSNAESFRPSTSSSKKRRYKDDDLDWIHAVWLVAMRRAQS